MGKYLKSRPDDVSLCVAVEQRFLDVCGSYHRIKGQELVPPMTLDTEMFLWRTMRNRHRNRDFFHTEDEMKALREVAQWTCDVNTTIRDQPKITIEWVDI